MNRAGFVCVSFVLVRVMTPERWQQITTIFQVALQRDASSRAAYLNEACAGDDSLRREVDAMLASHDQASSLPTTLRVIQDLASPVTVALSSPRRWTSP